MICPPCWFSRDSIFRSVVGFDCLIPFVTFFIRFFGSVFLFCFGGSIVDFYF